MKKTILASALLIGAGTLFAGVNGTSDSSLLECAELMLTQSNTNGALDRLRLIDKQACSYSSLARTDFTAAQALFEAGDYTAARQAYMAMVQNYRPTVPDYQWALTGAADCLFAMGDFENAAKEYAKIDQNGFSPIQSATLAFRNAVAAYEIGDKDTARRLFTHAATQQAVRPEAEYYLGCLDFDKGDYTDAARHFALVTPSSAAGSRVPYYMAQIYFAQGSYDKALAQASRFTASKDPKDTEMLRIAGESLVRLNRKSEAIPLLRRYISASPVPLVSALYIVGLADYDSGSYSAALEHLRPVADRADGALQQSAYLYIGQALMHEGDTNSAILAFEKATKSDADADVQQAAFYNYAVAKFSGANIPFKSSSETFEDFMRRYPNGPYAERVAEYLSGGYMADNDYARALESIEKVAYPSEKLLKAKLRALYALAWQDYRAANYAEAAACLSKAERLARHDAATAAEVTLLQGEVALAQGKENEAAEKFEAYLRRAADGAANRPQAFYGLGYALYGSNSARATQAFESAAKSLPNPAAKADAVNRIADMLFADGRFAEAADTYQRAYSLNPAAADYAMFNIARMKGYMRDYEGKIKALNDFRAQFPNSALIPESYLETTQALISLGRNDDAIATYRTLIAEYPSTAQGRRGYLQMAMTLLDTGKRNEAIEAYKSVITLYPTSDEAAQANNLLKVLYADANRGDEYLRFISSVANAPAVDPGEAEELSFGAAMAEYKSRHTTAKLEQFISDYPKSAHTPAALAAMLDKAADQGDSSAADAVASRILESWPDSPAAEKALAHKADALYGAGQIPEALEAWQTLIAKASSPQMSTRARLGAMRAARDTGNTALAAEMADAVLASSSGAAELSEARFTKGVALDTEGKTQEAIDLWLTQADDVNDIAGAKSAFHAAEGLFESGKTDKALSVAQKFAQSGSPHRYWVARAFILISDIYKAKGKKFEAEEYLNALKENYPGNETDIFMMIDSRLENE